MCTLRQIFLLNSWVNRLVILCEEYINTAAEAHNDATNPLPASNAPKETPCLSPAIFLVALINAAQKNNIVVKPQKP